MSNSHSVLYRAYDEKLKEVDVVNVNWVLYVKKINKNDSQFLVPEIETLKLFC